MWFFNRERRAVKPLSDTSKRLAVCFTGTVQGVGFRWTCREIAAGRGLTGWVRNEFDGSVSLEIQGEAEDLGAFFTELTQSFKSRSFPISFAIDKKDEIPPIPGESDFAVVF